MSYVIENRYLMLRAFPDLLSGIRVRKVDQYGLRLHEAMARSRKPEVVADSAHAILTRPSRECTGNFFLCEDVLAEEGITDLDRYSFVEDADLQLDLFVEE